LLTPRELGGNVMHPGAEPDLLQRGARSRSGMPQRLAPSGRPTFSSAVRRGSKLKF
jgi:hypothetical protein